PDIPTVAFDASRAHGHIQHASNHLSSGGVRQNSSGSMYSMTNQTRVPASTALEPTPPPIRSPSLNFIVDSGHLTVMRTGEIMRNRGFSFSQSPGARDVIMGRNSSTDPGGRFSIAEYRKKSASEANLDASRRGELLRVLPRGATDV
ncbi:hypothetical protein HK101_009589, partial [Irineochytrium annulatum]